MVKGKRNEPHDTEMRTTDSMTRYAPFAEHQAALQSAYLRSLEGEQEEFDVSFLKSYSLKYTGCNQITQLSGYSNSDEESIKIQSYPLLRFRLCPKGVCSNGGSSGCSSNYGDYIVKMSTALKIYTSEGEESAKNSYNASVFDPRDYLSCQSYSLPANGTSSFYTQQQSTSSYGVVSNNTIYIGPYCSGKASGVRLGVFSENTCAKHVNGGVTAFSETFGFELPYASKSMISGDCFRCYSHLNLCEDIYSVAGKCESQLEVTYPNDSACTFLDRMTRYTSNGASGWRNARSSKSATIAVEVLVFATLLLWLYVYCLRKSKW